MSAPLIDQFGRRHNNLRIAVTDRCNIRCTYCMPEEVIFQPRESLLSFEEIARFVRIAATLGVDKLRLTGGEPLVRSDLDKLVRMLVQTEGIRDVGLTTNGVLLEEKAKALFDAGLSRVNVSLDSLDRERFRTIARRDVLDRVLAGLDAAIRAGFKHIKINAVAMKGVTEPDILPLARFCRERGFTLRFIEFMPLEADQIWTRSCVLTAEEILNILGEAGLKTRPLPPDDPSAPATEYEYLDGRGRVGVIASVSKPFCGDCNRLRLTADGRLRNCLFALDETDIKGPLRARVDDHGIAQLIRDSVRAKWAGHLINSPQFERPLRTMHTIGG